MPCSINRSVSCIHKNKNRFLRQINYCLFFCGFKPLVEGKIMPYDCFAICMLSTLSYTVNLLNSCTDELLLQI